MIIYNTVCNTVDIISWKTYYNKSTVTTNIVHCTKYMDMTYIQTIGSSTYVR